MGGGKTETKHEHYTDFEIDGKIFRCYGDLAFKDGDSVKRYADKTDKGYYKVAYIENFTRGFVKANSYFDNPPKSIFGVVTKGIAWGVSFGILATIIVAVIVFVARLSNNIATILLLASLVLCVILGFLISFSEMKNYLADFKEK